jgi:3-methyladenine DNA glycosylase AlkC
MSHPLANRKPARRMAEIPADVLKAINRGEVETLNLVEFLAIDHQYIGPHVLEQAGFEKLATALRKNLNFPTKAGIMEKLRLAARTIGLEAEKLGEKETVLAFMTAHHSDIIEQYAAVLIGEDQTLDDATAYQRIRPFAADANFGTRELAFFVVRHRLIANTEAILDMLLPWTLDKDENIRRFASEGTRPRGVWVPHVPLLRKNPSLALPLLENLSNDPSRYVQNSVANWLNDAGKDHSEFTRDVCSDWLRLHPESKHTAYIVKRGMRSLG